MRAAWPFSILYAVTVLVAAILIGVLDVYFRSAWPLAIVPTAIWLSVEDARHGIVPDLATTAIAAIGTTAVLLEHGYEVLMVRVLLALATLLVLWAMSEVYFRKTGQEGLGLGDVKLIAALAIPIGWALLPFVILFASLGGIIYLLVRGRPSPRDGIAFAPFIVYAGFVVIGVLQMGQT